METTCVHKYFWTRFVPILKFGQNSCPNKVKKYFIFTSPSTAMQTFYFSATHHLPVGVMWSQDLMYTGQMAQTRARQVCTTRVELARGGRNSLGPDVERPRGAQHRGFRLFPPAFLHVLVKANAPALIWRPIRTHLRL
jgi:hypothetical protein